MGKNKKKDQSSPLPSVTILTPTTSDRQKVLHLLSKCVDSQVYNNVTEWLIIDGSKNCKFVDRSSISCSKCPIRWIEPNGLTISALRQKLKDSFESEIAVCFDDDDYYPPTRISHAVEHLIKTRKQIAGCTCHLVFDLDLGQAFRFNGFHENHATHNTMAFTRMYAKTHNYDLTLTRAEERSFTNNFSEPMAQLDYMHAVLHMFHSNNTFNKLEMSFTTLLEQNLTNMRLWRSKPIVSADTIQSYTEILSPDISSEVPDIVYFLGINNVYIWEPTTKSLGGSEQAVVELCKEWVAIGYTVHVYGQFESDILVDGVLYKNWKSFNLGMTYKNLILWRTYGCIPLCKVPRLRYRRLILDLHDTNLPNINKEPISLEQFDRISVKSYFHGTALGLKNAVIIPNGIRRQYFNIDKSYDRDNYRCIYASSYDRGLKYILIWAWPLLKKLVPKATLDVYYGMGLVSKEFKEEMEPLLKQPGVTDHGRCSVDIIRDAKFQSGFHLYFSKTFAETDCISIKESFATGCIPILSSYGVFRERNGIHIKGDPSTKEAQENMARVVAYLMEIPDTLEAERKNIASLEIQDWEKTAKMWIENILI
jgi:glycosyltransferase involved in cell wall biosynthesis